jgi:hypothetical protein
MLGERVVIVPDAAVAGYNILLQGRCSPQLAPHLVTGCSNDDTVTVIVSLVQVVLLKSKISVL